MKHTLDTLSLLPIALIGCTAPRSNDVGTTRQAIIGGTTDNGDPSVVALLMSTNQGQALCTTEVIASTVLLTAAHCVSSAELGPGASFDVVPGTNVGNPTGQIVVREVHNDPAFDTNHPEYGHDVGIVILSTPLSLTPLPFNRATMPQTMVGQAVRLVGYGLNDAARQSGAGTKRQVTTQLDDFDNMLLHIGGNGRDSCSGDSGGPAFMTVNGVETIMGVTSFGDQNCSTGGYYTRIDQYTSFIEQYIPTPTCTPQCSGRSCGADGCGGSCGVCGGGQSCGANGQCVSVCTPQCSGKSCGADGCGGSCGSCGTGQSCDGNGQCMSACAPQCNGRSCGPDGCGGSCGNCGNGQSCTSAGQCMSQNTNACDARGGVEGEPNDAQSVANALCSNNTIRGAISTPSDIDWYTWNLAADVPYTVHLTQLSHDMQLSLYKVLGGSLVWLGDAADQHNNADQSLNLYSETGGTYYVTVSGVNGAYDGSHTYQLQLTP